MLSLKSISLFGFDSFQDSFANPFLNIHIKAPGCGSSAPFHPSCGLVLMVEPGSLMKVVEPDSRKVLKNLGLTVAGWRLGS